MVEATLADRWGVAPRPVPRKTGLPGSPPYRDRLHRVMAIATR
ncbi:hypothetical protein [Streptomyces sp. NBC_01589]